MNVLHISTFDSGGAGAYAVQMNELLLSEGFGSQLIVRNALVPGPNVISVDAIAEKGTLDFTIKKTKRFVNKRKNGVSWEKVPTHFDYYFFQDERDEHFTAAKILKNVTFKPDVIFLYWISEFITSKTIHELYKITGARIYWLMMDNAPVTGGCHYPWNCIGYQSGCTDCPAIIDKKHIIKATENLALKQKLLPLNLTFIAFSEQDYQRARSSQLGRTRNVIKRLGFMDENIFKPGDKALAKSHFGIDSRSKVLFFGSAKINEKRKGMDLLVKALQYLNKYFAENQVEILYAGHEMPEISGIPFINAGFLNEEELVLAYTASDVFVCPSIEDSGPIMINQSLMCGTPVVAFESGVALDLVINGQTGYRAAINDVLGFSDGIREILELSSSSKKSYSEMCREKGMANSGRPAFQKFCAELQSNI